MHGYRRDAQHPRCFSEPLHVEPRSFPHVLEQGRPSDRLGNHNKRASDTQCEQSASAPHSGIGAPPAVDSVQTEHAKVLRGEVVGDQPEIDHRKCHHALGPREGQCLVSREQDGETGCGDYDRNDNEARGLRAQQRPVRGCRIGQPRRTQSMADPEQGSEGEDQQIQRAIAGIAVVLREHQSKWYQPEG